MSRQPLPAQPNRRSHGRGRAVVYGHDYRTAGFTGSPANVSVQAPGFGASPEEEIFFGSPSVVLFTAQPGTPQLTTGSRIYGYVASNRYHRRGYVQPKRPLVQQQFYGSAAGITVAAPGAEDTQSYRPLKTGFVSRTAFRTHRAVIGRSWPAEDTDTRFNGSTASVNVQAQAAGTLYGYLLHPLKTGSVWANCIHRRAVVGPMSQVAGGIHRPFEIESSSPAGVTVAAQPGSNFIQSIPQMRGVYYRSASYVHARARVGPMGSTAGGVNIFFGGNILGPKGTIQPRCTTTWPRKKATAAWVGGSTGPWGAVTNLKPNPKQQWWTTNFCPNPSFEVDLTGWEATDLGTSVTQVEAPSPVLRGTFAMQVTTDGTEPEQGTIGPRAIIDSPSGAVTVNIWGQGVTLQVTVLSYYDGIVLGTQIVTPDSEWVTVTLNNLSPPPYDSGYYVVISTLTAEASTFFIDCVQYEGNSPAHPYCDGAQPGCFWEGAADESASYQPYEFFTLATASLGFSGHCNIVTDDLIIAAEVEALEFEFSDGSINPILALNIVNPIAAMTDFGIWELTDPDPAQTYCYWNNEGMLSGYSQYNRSYGYFTPPLEYTTSEGVLWNQAVYAAIGFQWTSLGNNILQILLDTQLEMVQLDGSTAITPQAYQKPRQLQVIVKPDRLNYITNPNFESGTVAGWTGIAGNEAVYATQDAPDLIDIATYNNTTFNPGNWAMEVDMFSYSAQGAQISIPYLIPGYIYTVSCYILPNQNVGDVVIACGGATGDLAGQSGTGYGAGDYGSGGYGGYNDLYQPLPNTWLRASCTFTAAADTETLQVTPIPIVGNEWPVSIWLDAALCEGGDILLPYFDGNSGLDALWELDGTADLTRSYYYSQYQYGQQVVTSQLTANLPMGISYASPLYGTVPTQ